MQGHASIKVLAYHRINPEIRNLLIAVGKVQRFETTDVADRPSRHVCTGRRRHREQGGTERPVVAGNIVVTAAAAIEFIREPHAGIAQTPVYVSDFGPVLPRPIANSILPRRDLSFDGCVQGRDFAQAVIPGGTDAVLGAAGILAHDRDVAHGIGVGAKENVLPRAIVQDPAPDAGGAIQR